MTSPSTHETDIHLDTPEGLVGFVNHVSEQHAEFSAAAKLLEEDVSAMVNIKKGNDAYSELREAIAIAKAELTEGKGVSDESLSAIQSVYDQFAEAYMAVTAATPQENTEESDAEGAAITPRYAIRERFEQSLEDIETATDIYAPKVSEAEETSLPHLTFAQLAQYREKIQTLLKDLKAVDEGNQTEIAYFHATSLDIEEGVLRVAAALEDMFPDSEVKTAQPESSREVVAKSSLFTKSVKPFLTERLRSDGDIQAVVDALFPSMQVFERSLWQYVARIEEPSKLDKVLRVQHGSIFGEILKGMTLAEVDAMKALDGEQIRAALIEMQHEDNVQYDYTTFVMWMDEYADLKETIETYEDMYFEELIAISELVTREENQE